MVSEDDTAEVEGPPEVSENPKGRKRRSSTSALPPKPKKQYTKRAEIWNHFVLKPDDDKKAICKYCRDELGCDSKLAGTSTMIQHKARCKRFKDHDEKEKQQVISSDKAGNMKVVKFDPVAFRRSVNEMVVVNELPFSFVESEGWKKFCFNVLPMYKTFSRRTCCKDIATMYVEEKAALKELFRVQNQRVSLTTDIWVSPSTSYNYMVITGHWIDVSWKMQKRILGFKVITDHRADTIQGQLIDCMEEWGIQKLFTVTVDNATANDKAVRLLKEYLVMLGSDTLVLGGEYVHMRCCAHILNLIVSDGLKLSKPSIVAIRNALKYVRSSFSRLKSFEMRCETGKISRGSLPLDVKTRWNSTYLMLTAALKVRVAFEKMLLEDKLYCDYFLEEDEKTKTKRVGPPTISDWDEVQVLVKFLKIFYKSTLTFSASKSVTSTLCYNEIVNIEKNLISKCGNNDANTRKQAHVMRNKFEKYWDGLMNMNPLVTIGSVFDPRNKMQFASLCFEELYGKDTIESRKLNSSIDSVLRNLYNEYSTRLKNPEESQLEESQADHEVPTRRCELSDDDDDDDYGQAIYNKMQNLRKIQDGCSELDIYFTENPEIRVENKLGLTFDVLSWWKCNSSKFPVLSELARDVLAIQVSSVASESAFSTSGRVLDTYRSSLTPYMVEVLFCTQQWLRCNYKAEEEVASIMQMLQEVEFFESLDARKTVT